MDIRYINRTDLVVAGTCLFNIALLAINTALGSIIPLYISGLISFVVIIYWAIFRDAPGMLRRSLIVGSIGGFFYTFADRLFVDAGIVAYLRVGDLHVYKTPLSVIFLWMYFPILMLYLYQRLRSRFSHFYIPSLLTGISAFLFGYVLNYLGDKSRQWIWNASGGHSIFIGPVPLFVLLSFFFTFFLSPYIIGVKGFSTPNKGSFFSRYFRASDNPIVGGVRCAIVLSASLFILLQVFIRLMPYM